MKINVGVSNRHVHLTEDDYRILFGNETVEKIKDLTQPGEFATSLKVNIKTFKNEIKNVRVLGPFRKYTQVEISKTDSYTLGINPPVRNSGDLEDCEEVTVVGSCGQITKRCCIIATRHIHISPEERVSLGLMNRDYVDVKIGSIKKATIEQVFLKEAPNSAFELHIDTDDANANFIKNGDVGEIIV